MLLDEFVKKTYNKMFNRPKSFEIHNKTIYCSLAPALDSFY